MVGSELVVETYEEYENSETIYIPCSENGVKNMRAKFDTDMVDSINVFV